MRIIKKTSLKILSRDSDSILTEKRPFDLPLLPTKNLDPLVLRALGNDWSCLLGENWLVLPHNLKWSKNPCATQQSWVKLDQTDSKAGIWVSRMFVQVEKPCSSAWKG